MQNEHSQLTPIGTTHADRVSRTADLLRGELASFVEPSALTEMLALASSAASNTAVDDVLREMRASMAGMLLNRVGAFMVTTQNEIERSERLTRPPTGRNRAAA